LTRREVSGDDGSQSVSPHVVYNVVLARSPQNEGSNIVQRNYEFLWHRPEPAEASLFCPSLGEDVCASYGVGLSSDRRATVEELCSDKSALKANVSASGGRANVTFWYLERAKVAISCYLWITPNGLPPRRHSNSISVNRTLVDRLVSTFLSFRSSTPNVAN